MLNRHIPLALAALTSLLFVSLCSCKGKTANGPTAGEPAAAEPVAFADYFLDKTMRMDFYHCGSATDECYFFDELKEEPYFAGSHVALTDSFNYGNQRFVLLDKASGREIYSTHYCTLWNEWSCTPEARDTPLGMPESVVFPYPIHDAVAQIWSRSPATKNVWQLKFEHDIPAGNYFVRGFSPLYEVSDLHVVGEPQHCLDIVLIPEGYTEADRDQFMADCQLFASEFFRFEPWTSNEQRVNMRVVWAPSRQAGVSIPAEHKWVDTAVKANYYTFDSERYQMTMDMQNLRDIAGNAPYEYIYIISNSQKYGGGAIYNWYGISAAHIFSRPESVRKTYAHEFGHLLLGLGDDRARHDHTEDTFDGTLLVVVPAEVNRLRRTLGKVELRILGAGAHLRDRHGARTFAEDDRAGGAGVHQVRAFGGRARGDDVQPARLPSDDRRRGGRRVRDGCGGARLLSRHVPLFGGHVFGLQGADGERSDLQGEARRRDDRGETGAREGIRDPRLRRARLPHAAPFGTSQPLGLDRILRR